MATPDDVSLDVESPELEEMTVEDLAVWLKDQGIPDIYCSTFEENYIDGSEFVKLSEEEVKEIIAPIGLAKKVLRLIAVAQPKTASNAEVALPRNVRSSFSPRSPFSPAPLSLESDESLSLASSTASSLEHQVITIPDHWWEETEMCIADHVLDSEARSDIVRTLVTLLVSKYGPKPGTSRCQDLARQLIFKYPFMSDDLGSGYYY